MQKVRKTSAGIARRLALYRLHEAYRKHNYKEKITIARISMLMACSCGALIYYNTVRNHPEHLADWWRQPGFVPAQAKAAVRLHFKLKDACK
jgi:hypothetical protein